MRDWRSGGSSAFFLLLRLRKMHSSPPMIVFLLLVAHLVCARESNHSASSLNASSLHLTESASCLAIDAAMAPVCGDRARQWEHKCEKQCVHAVEQLLRANDVDNMCLVEWKVVRHLQNTQCTESLFGLRSMSVTTIASAFLSVFLLFSCTS
ncbi:hypothetical protein SDRG_09842 [Saprolegnia diclina VS20]|uniref:Transmembrane protein n=1 Tax=Saprolegnia diclina (strain VS20) TaxID=1156394 RepID=T0QCV2_SAPDV|nr:hypothetical protein SDRG_09842 [Saprolegnia diclina VS20]EQC32516.1 hypothetical protein SDRG_09842 [Saprolegnia diclina VS20]|eukprot:XP_008614017.1 hypothetical protein SDRG_09842 [Saprolegnia diclina VS20]